MSLSSPPYPPASLPVPTAPCPFLPCPSLPCPTPPCPHSALSPLRRVPTPRPHSAVSSLCRVPSPPYPPLPPRPHLRPPSSAPPPAPALVGRGRTWSTIRNPVKPRLTNACHAPEKLGYAGATGAAASAGEKGSEGQGENAGEGGAGHRLHDHDPALQRSDLVANRGEFGIAMVEPPLMVGKLPGCGCALSSGAPAARSAAQNSTIIVVMAEILTVRPQTDNVPAISRVRALPPRAAPLATAWTLKVREGGRCSTIMPGDRPQFPRSRRHPPPDPISTRIARPPPDPARSGAAAPGPPSATLSNHG